MTERTMSFPDLWSESSLRPYLGEVKRRHGVVETLALPSMRDLPPVQIETLFVPPLLAQAIVSADTDPETWPQGRSLLVELQEFRQLVVLGDPGGGKTTLSNWLAWRLAAGLNSPLPEALKNRVPIPCVLRDMPVSLFSADVTLVDLANSVADKLLGSKNVKAIKQSLEILISQGAYVLILDGVDEIPLSHRQVVAGWIRTASEQGGCVLATSRIVGYEDGPVDCSDGAALNISNRKFSDKFVEGKFNDDLFKDVSLKRASGFRSVDSSEIREPVKWAHIRYLMPFDQGRVASFAENWYRQRCMTRQEAAQKTTDLLSALIQSEVTQKLARTPNLLSLMAIVHRERAHLPDGKALLYEEIVNAYINTIDKQRKIAPGDVLAQYGWKERKAWLAYVGFKMQVHRGIGGSRDMGILSDESDVERWLTDAMIISGVPSPDHAAKTFLNWVARRSGLLLPRGEARYAFVHLSFQEYFCACYLDSCIVRPAFIKDKLQLDADVTKNKLAEWSGEPHWFETLIFLFELLSAERDSEWVDDLVCIIFGAEINHFNPYDRAAELASRIITNKHIKISAVLRDDLAASLGACAFEEWGRGISSANFGILSSLLNAGYAAVLAPVEDINASEDGSSLQTKYVNSIEVIEYPDKIRILIVEDVNAFEASFLRRLKSLRYLRIKNVNFYDVSFLSAFKDLKMLQLVSLPVKDLEPIATLSGLTHVELHELTVSDIGSLSKLKLLTTLELHDLKVDDLSPIAKLKSLDYLSLKDMVLNSVEALASLKALTVLHLNRLSQVDLSPISSLKKLTYLKIDDVPVHSISFLNQLTKLSNLDLRRLSLDDIAVVGNMSWLRSLYLISCEVGSLLPLKNMVKLRALGVMYMDVKNIDFVVGMKDLSTCFIAKLGVCDLSPFSSLKNLYTLSIEEDEMPDIAPLAECEGLGFLEIECETVVDVLPLRKLPKLHDLQLNSKGVENLTALEGIEGLNVRWEGF